MNIEQFPEIEHWSVYDWEVVLDDANNSAELISKNGSAGRITADRINNVLWITADSPEGYGSVDMACIVQLMDGRYAMCEAWADTTGWGCRDGVSWKVGYNR